jgi:hypothetical protein
MHQKSQGWPIPRGASRAVRRGTSRSSPSSPCSYALSCQWHSSCRLLGSVTSAEVGRWAIARSNKGCATRGPRLSCWLGCCLLLSRKLFRFSSGFLSYGRVLGFVCMQSVMDADAVGNRIFHLMFMVTGCVGLCTRKHGR